VVAFRKRQQLGTSSSGASAGTMGRKAELLYAVAGNGMDVVEGRAPSSPPPTPVRYKEVFRNGRPRSYVEKAKEMELTQKNAKAFFSLESGLVEKFGTTTVFYARLGFDEYGQSEKASKFETIFLQ